MSTTSPSTSSGAASPEHLVELIEALPPDLLRQALTHPSYADERADSYERLEFLGDSVLELIVAETLYERHPDSPEGDLSRLRASVVSRRSCALVARELGLDRLAERFELGDELRGSGNVLAALAESVIAALYLEHGLERISGPVRAAFLPRIVEAEETPYDYKTQLQEAAAARGHRVAYAILSSDGPPHDRLFTSAAMVDGRQRGVGSGRSKKDAEQEAAREALRVLEGGAE